MDVSLAIDMKRIIGLHWENGRLGIIVETKSPNNFIIFPDPDKELFKRVSDEWK